MATERPHMGRRVLGLITAAILVVIGCNASVVASPPGQPDPSESPVEALISNAFIAAQRVTDIASTTNLRSNLELAETGGLLTTMVKPWDPDELTSPQLVLGRELDFALDGTDVISENLLQLSAMAPNGSGNGLCYLVLEFNFTQHSRLTSGELTANDIAKALRSESHHLHLYGVGASLTATVTNGGIDYSNIPDQAHYDAESGLFQTAPTPRREPRPASDLELRKLTESVTHVATCVGTAFEALNSRDSSGGSDVAAVDARQLKELGICAVPCVITGHVALNHPTWGPGQLLTTVALEASDREAHVIFMDRHAVRWRYDSSEWSELKPDAQATDKTGNLFINYNPGRFNGVVVLRATMGGFEHFGSLPAQGAYAYEGRFYSGATIDTDNDGYKEVELKISDCMPTCAEGTDKIELYGWNGAEYVLR